MFLAVALPIDPNNMHKSNALNYYSYKIYTVEEKYLINRSCLRY